MAINKTKNNNLQITLSKADYEKLLSIQNDLSALLSIDLNKSQTIAFLIKNYGKTQPKGEILQEKQPKHANKNGVDYGAQVRALKDKLNVSYPKLSAIVGIPAPTLKKYGNDTQRPQGENLELLNQALKNYGIK